MEKVDPRAISALEAKADMIAARLAIVANPKRLLILCQLAKGERSVSALQEAVGLGQSALSQHLARMRDAGIVSTRREAQTIHYHLADPQIGALMESLYDAFCKHD